MFQKIKDKKKAKEISRLITQLPLWYKGARAKGYPDWETFAIELRLATPEQVEDIHNVILAKGRAENGCKPLLWTAEDWQNHIVG